MGFFNKLFGKKATPQESSNSNEDITPKLTVEDLRKEYGLDRFDEKEVVEGCYLEIENIDVDKLKHEISDKIKERDKIYRLMSDNARKEYPNNPDGLSSIYLMPDTVFLHNSTEADTESNNGNYERAADLLWTNVCHNATKAPAHYRQLSHILAKKLNRKDLSDRIEEIYDHVFS